MPNCHAQNVETQNHNPPKRPFEVLRVNLEMDVPLLSQTNDKAISLRFAVKHRIIRYFYPKFEILFVKTVGGSNHAAFGR